MRTRVIVPVIVLLAVFCGVLGWAVYLNVSSTARNLVVQEIDTSLKVIEAELKQVRDNGRTLTDAGYQAIIQGFGVTNGGVFVVDANGTIIADSGNVMTGISIAQESWYIEASKTTASEVNAVYGQMDVFAHTLKFDDKLLVSHVPQSTIAQYMNTPLYIIGVVGVAFASLIGVIAYLLITRTLINPIESLDDQIKALEPGAAIEVKPLRGCPEIATSAKRINKLLAQQGGVNVGHHPALGGTQQAAARQSGAAAATAKQSTTAAPAATASATQQPTTKQPATTAAAATAAAPATAAPAAAVATTKQPATKPPAATSFELADLVRATVEPYRDAITSRRLRFSLLLGNALPLTIVANYESLRNKMTALLTGVLNEAAEGSRVEGVVSLAKSAYSFDDDFVDILFTIEYNGTQQSVLLEAKRGKLNAASA